MITEPTDHGLYVIILVTAMNFFLYYFIVTTTLFLLYQLSYKSAQVFSKAQVLYKIYELNMQFGLIVGLQRKTTYKLTLFQILW